MLCCFRNFYKKLETVNYKTATMFRQRKQNVRPHISINIRTHHNKTAHYASFSKDTAYKM